MPLGTIQVYLMRLPGVQAEMKMALAEAASKPHMEKSDQRRVLKGWQRLAYGHVGMGAKKASKDDLRMIGIGVD